MGLGPPVCRKHLRVMVLDVGAHPQWRCPVCGASKEWVSHLFCLGEEDLRQVDANEGTDWAGERERWRHNERPPAGTGTGQPRA